MDHFQRSRGRWMEHGSCPKLPDDVSGQRVLDLGCGAGQLAYYLDNIGAAEVIEIVASERMLNVVRTEWTHRCVPYRRVAIQHVDFSSRGVGSGGHFARSALRV